MCWVLLGVNQFQCVQQLKKHTLSFKNHLCAINSFSACWQLHTRVVVAILLHVSSCCSLVGLGLAGRLNFSPSPMMISSRMRLA